MIDSNDGGVDITTNGGADLARPACCPSASSTTSACDNSVPYRVMGNMQDQGTASGPSNSLQSGGIPLSDWHTVGGGETGFAVADPKRPQHRLRRRIHGHHHALRPPHRQARNISIYPVNPFGQGRGGAEVPLPVDRPDPDLAARPQDDLSRAPTCCFRTTRRRQDLDRDQPRPDARRQDASRSGPAAPSPATTPAPNSTARSSPSPSRR